MLATSSPIFRVVADAPSGRVDIWGIMAWCAGLIVLLLVAAIILAWARRRLTAQPPAAVGEQSAWTLDALHRLHSGGLVSDEEHHRLRKKLIDALKGSKSSEGGSAGSIAGSSKVSQGDSPDSSDKDGPQSPGPGAGPGEEPGSQGSEPSGSNEGQAG
jgi:hypothetical protein